jgi:hypothetical protein
MPKHFEENKFSIITAYRVCCPDLSHKHQNRLGMEMLKLQKLRPMCKKKKRYKPKIRILETAFVSISTTYEGDKPSN